MRSYLRFDPEFADRKAHYPDGAVACFVMTLAFAEQQHPRGYFKRAVLKALLERRARWIPFLIDNGDLEEQSDGKLYLIGWTEWQEGDWKVQERVERIRTRRRTVTSGVTSDTPSTVNTPSEHLAVSGKHLAVSGKQGDRNGSPVDKSADETGVKTPRRLEMPRRGYKGGETTKLLDHLPRIARD